MGRGEKIKKETATQKLMGSFLLLKNFFNQ